ncbi:hypothetical protein F5Y19DRAFT_449468 [Xylariaceae sp. FL1651]|nr:hypothetical protein F5Y19DRAFT_449468 [Xylariaceae sp. FL1651]
MVLAGNEVNAGVSVGCTSELAAGPLKGEPIEATSVDGMGDESPVDDPPAGVLRMSGVDGTGNESPADDPCAGVLSAVPGVDEMGDESPADEVSDPTPDPVEGASVGSLPDKIGFVVVSDPPLVAVSVSPAGRTVEAPPTDVTIALPFSCLADAPANEPVGWTSWLEIVGDKLDEAKLVTGIVRTVVTVSVTMPLAAERVISSVMVWLLSTTQPKVPKCSDVSGCPSPLEIYMGRHTHQVRTNQERNASPSGEALGIVNSAI